MLFAFYTLILSNMYSGVFRELHDHVMTYLLSWVAECAFVYSCILIFSQF